MATGTLGSAIANSFSEYAEVKRVFYVHGEGAQRPRTLKADNIPITDFDALSDTVRELIAGSKIDAIIHSMAVSDYRVRAVTTAELIADSVLRTGGRTRENIVRAIADAERLDRSHKISSSEENLVLTLERTPKLIEQFKELAPNAVLVGFKLIDGVSHDELIAAARELITRSGAFLALANDNRDVTKRGHIGYLLDSTEKVARYETKEEIAKAISSRVMAELKSRAVAD
jgi:phosphopantothenate-cysteine ligase